MLVGITTVTIPSAIRGNLEEAKLILKFCLLGEWSYLFFLLLFNCSVLSDSLRPLDCSMLDFPVLHYLPEFAQTHIHWVDGTIQPSLLDLIHSGLSVLYDIGESCWIQVNLLCQWEIRCLWYWQEREARFICTFNKYLLNVCIVLYIKGSKIVTAITELSKIKKRKAREPG